MDGPLANLTQPTMQQMNRADDIPAPSSGCGPVYAPSVSTHHQQFVDLHGEATAPAPKSFTGSRTYRNNNGPSPNNRSFGNGNNRRGQFNGNSNNNRHHNNHNQHYQQQQHQLEMMNAAMTEMANQAPLDGDNSELQYQRLEEFAALQQQMNLLQQQMAMGSNGMPTGPNPFGPVDPTMAAAAAMLMAQGGNPMMGGMAPHHGPGPHPFNPMLAAMMMNGGMGMNGMGGMMPPMGMDPNCQMMNMMPEEDGFHPMAQQQQFNPQPQSRDVEPATADVPTPTPNTDHEGKDGEACPCIHCAAAAKMMTTPSGKTIGDASENGLSPEEFTPSQINRSIARDFETPPRRSTKEWRSQEKEKSSERRQPGSLPAALLSQEKPQSQRREIPSATKPLRELPAPRRVKNSPSSNPAGQLQFSCAVHGHFGRVFDVKSHFPIEVGTHVIFDGDRGDDLGLVKKVSPFDKNEPMNNGHKQRPSIVLRIANDDEISRWENELMEEAASTVKVFNDAARAAGLKMTVKCASYQFDHKKLTFYYESDERIDFRRLLSDMYNKFRCRIWMERTSELDAALVPK